MWVKGCKVCKECKWGEQRGAKHAKGANDGAKGVKHTKGANDGGKGGQSMQNVQTIWGKGWKGWVANGAKHAKGANNGGQGGKVCKRCK